MKINIKVSTYTIGVKKELNSYYNGSAIYNKEDNNVTLEYIDQTSIKNTINIYKDNVSIKRLNSILNLDLNNETIYSVNTPYGVLNLKIKTLELNIKDNYIYVRYNVSDEENAFHELEICLDI